MLDKVKTNFKQSVGNTRRVIHAGFSTLKRDPQIAAYPYMAVIFVSLTLPLANGLLFGIWNNLWHSALFNVTDAAPHSLRILLGLGSFTFFYTAFVSAYFTCAASGAVLAKLEGHPTTPLLGLRIMLRRFLKISKFALTSIFFFPLGLIAQRKKLPKGTLWAITSSFSLHMPQMAPVIMRENKTVMGSIRSSIDTFNKASFEGITLRVIILVAIPLLGVMAGLSNWAVHHFLHGDVAHITGWLVAMLIGSVGYVTVKVVGTVLATTLYYKTKQQK